MRRRYGPSRDNRSAIRLESAQVPQGLRRLIGLAERWGESDDLIREGMVRRASGTDLQELVAAMATAEVQLGEWLAGTVGDVTNAYTAFSCLRQAADLAKVLLEGQ